MQTETLRQIPLLSKLPEPQLQWLSQQGSEIWLEPGTSIAQEGDPPDGFYIILEGQTEWAKKVEGENVPAATLQAGEVFAELILLLDEPYPTSGRAVTRVHLYKLAPAAFWDLLNCCPDLWREILKIAIRRSQIHETVSQQQAKLISLGTLSAGLAHELNNPAAAVQRNVQSLETILQKLPVLALKIHSSSILHRNPCGIASDQISFLTDVYQQATATQQATSLDPLAQDSLDPLAQSEAEDAVSDWLDDHEIQKGWVIAPTFVAAGLSVDRLNEIADRLDPQCLGDVLTWLEATLTGVKLLDEISLSSSRISELIQAMKDYSHLDQAPIQDVNVHDGIESTLTILRHKLKHGVTVKREYGDLPRICAYGRELNQVWTNLIDNAIDAMQGKGTLTIRTSRIEQSSAVGVGQSPVGDHRDSVVVKIADTGSGIPTNVQPRIFEPFFTTKGVGTGTGLGLDIARRIVVQRHHGDISFTSTPQGTTFQIRLPIAQPQSVAPALRSNIEKPA